MTPLSQARFAALLADAMHRLDVTGAELADRTGIDRTTISRYRRRDYASGPPRTLTRRLLERALGSPEGWLDGDYPDDFDLPGWRRTHRLPGGPPAALPAAGGQPAVLDVLQGIRDQLAALGRQVDLVERLVRETRPPQNGGGRITPAEVAAVLEDAETAARARPAPPQRRRQGRSGRG